MEVNGHRGPGAMGFSLVRQLFSLGANIREIDASFCRSVTNTTLKQLPSLPALECLNLDGCQDVDDEAHVTHVACLRRQPLISTRQGLGAVASRCRGLRSFSIYWNVRARNLNQTPKDCHGRFRCHICIVFVTMLCSSVLCQTAFRSFPAQVTDQGLGKVLRAQPCGKLQVDCSWEMFFRTPSIYCRCRRCRFGFGCGFDCGFGCCCCCGGGGGGGGGWTVVVVVVVVVVQVSHMFHIHFRVAGRCCWSWRRHGLRPAIPGRLRCTVEKCRFQECCSLFQELPPWKLTSPLKNAGWNMKFPFKMVPFRVTCWSKRWFQRFFFITPDP